MPRGVPGSRSPHGTLTRYTQGCRCDECRAASREYARKKYGHRPREEYIVEHGAAAYKTRGCRCDVCRAHSAEVKRRYRESHPEYNAAQARRRRERHQEAKR